MTTSNPDVDDPLWTPVPGYEDYFAHPSGFIKSTRRVIPILIHGEISRFGYRRITVMKDGKTVRRHIHVMIADTFHPNPDGKPQVNHKNGVKLDNCVDNLEWCTASENMIHRVNVLAVKKPLWNKISNDDVFDVLSLKFLGARTRDIADAFGVSISLIKLVAKSGINYRVKST